MKKHLWVLTILSQLLIAPSLMAQVAEGPACKKPEQVFQGVIFTRDIWQSPPIAGLLELREMTQTNPIIASMQAALARSGLLPSFQVTPVLPRNQPPADWFTDTDLEGYPMKEILFVLSFVRPKPGDANYADFNRRLQILQNQRNWIYDPANANDPNLILIKNSYKSTQRALLMEISKFSWGPGYQDLYDYYQCLKAQYAKKPTTALRDALVVLNNFIMELTLKYFIVGQRVYFR